MKYLLYTLKLMTKTLLIIVLTWFYAVILIIFGWFGVIGLTSNLIFFGYAIAFFLPITIWIIISLILTFKTRFKKMGKYRVKVSYLFATPFKSYLLQIDSKALNFVPYPVFKFRKEIVVYKSDLQSCKITILKDGIILKANNYKRRMYIRFLLNRKSLINDLDKCGWVNLRIKPEPLQAIPPNR